jgi:group II intron reverse transcriptase/maturase
MQFLKLNGNISFIAPLMGRKTTWRKLAGNTEPVGPTPNELSKNFDENHFNDNLIQYQDLISIENLKAGLARTKSGKAAGLDGEIKADFSDDKITKLHKELKLQKYMPAPSKRVGIPKPKGGVRYLGIASQRDKVVQGALLNFLELKLEKIFLDSSKGFRPGKNCHGALKEIKYKWQSPTWLINVDITKAFDKLQHDTLLKLCGEHCDQATVELIGKMLRAGYVDIHNLNDRSEYKSEGTPQGSLISPILCNLYLHEFDKMVTDELLTKWNYGKERSFRKEYHARFSRTELEKEFLRAWPEFSKPLEIAKHNKVVLDGSPSRDPHDENFRRLYYVRYADDFILGFSGTSEEAISIKEALFDGLNKIGLQANLEKSSVSHCKERDLVYLGVYLKYTTTKRIAVNDRKGNPDFPNLKSISFNNAQLRVPILNVLNKAVDRGHAKLRKNGTYRATSKRQWCSLTEAQIVTRYSSVIRGILQYYSCVNQRSDLWSVVSLYRKACALTLADKLKLRTAAKVFKKFGPRLTINSATSKKSVSLDYPTSLKTKVVFKTGNPNIQLVSIAGDQLGPLDGSYRANNPKKPTCEAEGCTSTIGLEAHHTNPMKGSKVKGGFKRSLISKARKTVTLCKHHHYLVHNTVN